MDIFKSAISSVSPEERRKMESEAADIRRRAVQDAKDMQKLVSDNCRKLNIPVPEFDLLELTGKGAYGRVYKA